LLLFVVELYFEKKFYSNSDRPYQLIDMKDKKLKNKIIRKMKNYIGVHIRRGDIPIAYYNKKDPDQRDYYVSNKKIEKKGFKAQVLIEHGIDELINIFSYSDEKIINNY